MKNSFRFRIGVILLFMVFVNTGDTSETRSGSGFLPHKLRDTVNIESEKNGVIVPRAWDFQAEIFSFPGLKKLRQDEKLDEVLGEGTDEWNRMVPLCRWVYNQFASSKPSICPPWNASVILSNIRSGKSGGFCAQYAVIQVQAALSLGWQARYLDVDTEPRAGGHITVEIWSNQFNKWAVLDPHFGCYLESVSSPGVPLSALEIHDLLTKGRKDALKVISVGGNEKIHPPIKADIRDFFFHLGVDLRNNHLSRPLNTWNLRETYLAWKDGHTRGRPEIFTRFTEDFLDFNFPLNQVEFTLQTISKNRISCVFRTSMPGATWLRIEQDRKKPMLLELVPGITQTSYDRIKHLNLGEPLCEPDTDSGASKHSDAQPAQPKSPKPKQAVFFTAMGYGLLLRHDMQLHPGKNRFSLQAVNELGVVGPAARCELLFTPDCEDP